MSDRYDVVDGIDPVYELIGKIIIVRLNKRSFSAKLIRVIGSGDDQELWFQRSDGICWMVKRSAIRGISPIRGRGRAAEAV